MKPAMKNTTATAISLNHMKSMNTDEDSIRIV